MQPIERFGFDPLPSAHKATFVSEESVPQLGGLEAKEEEGDEESDDEESDDEDDDEDFEEYEKEARADFEDLQHMYDNSGPAGGTRGNQQEPRHLLVRRHLLSIVDYVLLLISLLMRSWVVRSTPAEQIWPKLYSPVPVTRKSYQPSNYTARPSTVGKPCSRILCFEDFSGARPFGPDQIFTIEFFFHFFI